MTRREGLAAEQDDAISSGGYSKVAIRVGYE
jgi:hypothetical protein